MPKDQGMSLSKAMEKVLNTCCKPYYKHKKRIERENRPRRDYSFYRVRAKTMKEWLWEVFPEAYKIASDNGSIIPMVRQLYYVVRRLLQEKGCELELTDAYHRSTLEEYEKYSVGHRLCYRKAVGNLIEPHSACPLCRVPSGCSLGTQSTEQYVVPSNCYNKVLYVEKAGFMQQLLSARIHEKYDIAIAAGAGFAVQAAKELFAKIEKKNISVKIYCLHDADISGVEIARTLNKKLLFENYQVTINDLGLKPKEAIELRLPSEKVSITSHPSYKIRKMVSKQELDWLLGEEALGGMYRGQRRVISIGNRVELNAFTPSEFIKWVNKKLSDLEEGKVMPEQSVIEKHANKVKVELIRKKIADYIMETMDLDAIIDKIDCEDITPEYIQSELANDGFASWKDITKKRVKEKIDELDIEKEAKELE